MQERNQEGQGGAGARHEDQLRDCCWQGGLHLRVLEKVCHFFAPLLYLGHKRLTKFVLLVEVPGDLSDHGVGVAHKAEAVLQQLKKTGNNNT